MEKHINNMEMAVGMFYGAGVIIGASAFLTIGFITGQWFASFCACIGGGIGFGLIMQGCIYLRK